MNFADFLKKEMSQKRVSGEEKCGIRQETNKETKQVLKQEVQQLRQMISVRLLNQGVGVFEIAEATGLLVEEIDALKKQVL